MSGFVILLGQYGRPLILCFLATLCFAGLFHVPGKALPVAAGIGTLGYLVWLLVTYVFSFTDVGFLSGHAFTGHTERTGRALAEDASYRFCDDSHHPHCSGNRPVSDHAQNRGTEI